MLKKDGKSLRLVHSLEPLNKVTIAHSGVPLATETLAAQFAGRACGGMLDLYVGYDEQTLLEDSRDLTTFQTAEIMIVGHRCTYDGRLPETDRVGVIKWWSACNNVSEV